MSVLFNASLPVVPLRSIVAMPFVLLSFDIGRPGNIAAIDAAVNSDNRIIIVCQKDPRSSDMSRHNLFETGCVCRITKIIKLPEGNTRIFVEGVSRARIDEYVSEAPYLEARFTELGDYPCAFDEASTLRQMISRKFREFTFGNGKTPVKNVVDSIELIPDDIRYVYSVANVVMLQFEDRQKFIEQEDQSARCLHLLTVMKREAEFAKLTQKIDADVRAQIDKNQKEYFLREQIRAIRKELGENEQTEADEFREKLEKKKLPDEVRERISREIERFSTLPAGSHEMPSMRAFIECMLDLPFTEASEDNLDIDNARAVLNRDHYGLEKVKERVLEHLAVARLTGKVNGQIICFVGPPGVGKTSISSSIAEALGRRFVRMSLGGIKDEAEIRGHRRTYIGAMPGRIIAAMRTAGTINPVLLFDEIDKLAKDYQGDPAAAMLEVLDSAQNFAFRDHFLEMPYDLSKVMFITTANSLYDIPDPLRDRMEIIEVPSYLANEKVQIALRHLIPKQLEKHGLKKTQLSIPASAVEDMVSEYTREAGVRSLERCIASVCRKAACDIASGKTRIRITKAKLHEYLGVPKYIDDTIEKAPAVGVVNGLAWTAVGGSTMQIEVAALPGSGQLQLTGKLGDVMQESAKTAITCIRAHADKLGLAADFVKNTDIHIHVPEGAVPKDGPSAGISILTAVSSALCGIPVKPLLAMTGEITLRGRVLPIGGLREKLLAALRAGIKEVLIPETNRKDLEEVPADIIEKLSIVFVRTSDEVLKNALLTYPVPAKGGKPDPVTNDAPVILPGMDPVRAPAAGA
ncbi:MAG: endopeptidase La [Clostridiales bacterium]|nr:endopeptidase La [Clostridiales bacterium]